MLNIQVPTNIQSILKQVRALEYALQHDSLEKDKVIHSNALEVLISALNQ